MSPRGFFHDGESNPIERHRPDATVIVTDHRPVGDVAAPGAKERLGQVRWRRWCRAAHDLTVASHRVAAVGGHGVPSASAVDAVCTGSSYQAVVAAESIESVVTGATVDEIGLRGSPQDVRLTRSDDPLECSGVLGVCGENRTYTRRCHEARDGHSGDERSPAGPHAGSIAPLHGRCPLREREFVPGAFSRVSAGKAGAASIAYSLRASPTGKTRPWALLGADELRAGEPDGPSYMAEDKPPPALPCDPTSRICGRVTYVSRPGGARVTVRPSRT
jgi:hypothetical protein